MVLTVRKSWHWLVSATLVLLGLVILNVDPAAPKAVAKNNPSCGMSGTYDPNTQDCCCTDGSCGSGSCSSGTIYDIATQGCCCGTVYDPSTQGCCNGVTYDLITQQCCQGVVTSCVNCCGS
jgi:hypothetical protein